MAVDCGIPGSTGEFCIEGATVLCIMWYEFVKTFFFAETWESVEEYSLMTRKRVKSDR